MKQKKIGDECIFEFFERTIISLLEILNKSRILRDRFNFGTMN